MPPVNIQRMWYQPNADPCDPWVSWIQMTIKFHNYHVIITECVIPTGRAPRCNFVLSHTSQAAAIHVHACETLQIGSSSSLVFLIQQNYLLEFSNYYPIWQMSLQLRCGNTWKIWKLNLLCSHCFLNIEKLNTWKYESRIWYVISVFRILKTR